MKILGGWQNGRPIYHQSFLQILEDALFVPEEGHLLAGPGW